MWSCLSNVLSITPPGTFPETGIVPLPVCRSDFRLQWLGRVLERSCAVVPPGGIGLRSLSNGWCMRAIPVSLRETYSVERDCPLEFSSTVAHRARDRRLSAGYAGQPGTMRPSGQDRKVRSDCPSEPLAGTQVWPVPWHLLPPYRHRVRTAGLPRRCCLPSRRTVCLRVAPACLQGSALVAGCTWRQGAGSPVTRPTHRLTTVPREGATVVVGLVQTSQANAGPNPDGRRATSSRSVGRKAARFVVEKVLRAPGPAVRLGGRVKPLPPRCLSHRVGAAQPVTCCVRSGPERFVRTCGRAWYQWSRWWCQSCRAGGWSSLQVPRRRRCSCPAAIRTPVRVRLPCAADLVGG